MFGVGVRDAGSGAPSPESFARILPSRQPRTSWILTALRHIEAAKSPAPERFIMSRAVPGPLDRGAYGSARAIQLAGRIHKISRWMIGARAGSHRTNPENEHKETVAFSTPPGALDPKWHAHGGSQMAFQLAVFRQLANDAGYKPSRFSTRSMDPVIALMQNNAPALNIMAAINNIAVAKREKYREAIQYFALEYPGVVPAHLIQNGAAFIPGRPTFQQAFYGTPHNPLADGDLIYGRSEQNEGRDSLPYLPPNAANPAGNNRHKPWRLDEFNNAANLGTGLAFDQTWNGISGGPLNAANIRNTALADRNTPNFGPGGGRPVFQQPQYQAYLDGLFASKYSPDRAVNIKKKQLEKHNWRKQPAQMVTPANFSADKAAVAHARFFKAIRRICKGGIAMVATSAQFVNARVHFVLDGLGDLGQVARKQNIGNALPITSSELCFTCRHWQTLDGKVLFWLNGQQVHPPWELDWSANDSNGNVVHAGQESWLRYLQYRTLANRNGLLDPWP